MVITIRVTPRTIERTILLILLIFFISTTAYYSWMKTGTCMSDGLDAADETDSATEEATEAASEPEPAPEPAPESTPEPEEGTTGSTSYTDVEITIAPIKYRIKELVNTKKAVVDTMSFIIKNKMSKDIAMKVEVYFWDSSSSEGFRTYPKDTVTLSAIKAGTTSTQSYGVENINMYNFDLEKTFKFTFIDIENNEVVATTIKKLTITE